MPALSIFCELFGFFLPLPRPALYYRRIKNQKREREKDRKNKRERRSIAVVRRNTTAIRTGGNSVDETFSLGRVNFCSRIKKPIANSFAMIRHNDLSTYRRRVDHDDWSDDRSRSRRLARNFTFISTCKLSSHARDTVVRFEPPDFVVPYPPAFLFFLR